MNWGKYNLRRKVEKGLIGLGLIVGLVGGAKWIYTEYTMPRPPQEIEDKISRIVSLNREIREMRIAFNEGVFSYGDALALIERNEEYERVKEKANKGISLKSRLLNSLEEREALKALPEIKEAYEQISERRRQYSFGTILVAFGTIIGLGAYNSKRTRELNN